MAPPDATHAFATDSEDWMGTNVPENPPASGAQPTVLIVENDPFLRSMYSHVLEQDGFHVLTAPDVVTALLLADAQRESIALVVCDTLLPGLGRLESWRHTVKNGHGPRALFLSSDPRHAGLDLPVLAKPFHPDAFLRLVRDLAASRPSRSQP